MHPKTNSRYSDIDYPNTCCHNVLLLTIILTSAFIYFCSIGEFCLCVLTVAIAIKIVTIFPMYELGIMAYDVAVIRSIVVALER